MNWKAYPEHAPEPARLYWIRFRYAVDSEPIGYTYGTGQYNPVSKAWESGDWKSVEFGMPMNVTHFAEIVVPE